ncbi:MAG: family acetyltransferase [Sphingobacterium sp.]|jgi:predicted N-acetyltransferase YhbS|uniref:GNAT family N-acetyltransferase n=1 Tax=unclassified Sphingobacterium TaxID=2609468 RepID=UPI00158F18E3|nr:N-acetyltransferase [Sphingobacterium sp. CZ-UAM]MDF2515162.1 family acetyltransferase [Sphingobacterium sp.]
MKIHIRQESAEDYETVFELIQKAFEHAEYTDHQEQFLVQKLRQSSGFIPELALIAEINGRPVGYILVTKIKIVDEENKKAHSSLALAPIAVLPDFQGKGIGSKLIKEAHRIARQLGFGSIILLGHADYYPRYGYVQMVKYGIKMPFDVPDENCMIIELLPEALVGVKGMVVYPKEFGIT